MGLHQRVARHFPDYADRCFERRHAVDDVRAVGDPSSAAATCSSTAVEIGKRITVWLRRVEPKSVL